MKVLVTGANGFLGSAVVRRILERGLPWNVRCMHRQGSELSRLDAVDAALPSGRVERLAGNLVSRADCARAVDGMDAVIHGAAAMSGAAADMFLNTVVASRNLLDAILAQRRPMRVVVVSSFGVYGMASVPEGTVVTEDAPLEPHPERRDVYSHAKHRQERLFRDYEARHGIEVTILRPGVIHGPTGPAMSARVGLRFPGVFLHLGRRNILPLTYVDNCADALIEAASSRAAVGGVYNVVDDDLPTACVFLARYRREVEPLRVLSLPLVATRLLARAVGWYHDYSRGQLPAVLTPYKTESTWRSFRYDNARLKKLGWRPEVPMNEALQRTFASLAASRRGALQREGGPPGPHPSIPTSTATGASTRASSAGAMPTRNPRDPPFT